MARIVLVHGAFNELWGPHELKARWLPAVRDGLWHHGIVIDDDDVTVCFYGDEFRVDPETWDLDEWRESKAGAEELLESLGGAHAMEFLSQAAGKAAYERTVAMVAVMAGDPGLRDRIHQRLLDRIGRDTRVVVAHSLGSVIAYRALRAHPDVEVDTLVTLGSPLGGEMTAADGADWPGGVGRWVDVSARGDAAATPSVAARFGARVEEHLVDNGHRAHDPEPYLNARATGAAIARALRAS